MLQTARRTRPSSMYNKRPTCTIANQTNRRIEAVSDCVQNVVGLRFQRPLTNGTLYMHLAGVGVGWRVGDTEGDQIKKTLKVPYTGARFLIENVGKTLGF